DGILRPLVYISRTTLKNERNWDTSDLEAGALVWAIKKLRVYLYGTPFDAHTDHQPLVSFLSMGERRPRIHRMCDFLSNYQFKLNYKKGNENQVADALSRLPLEATYDDVTGKCRLIDEGDVEVYFVGAAGLADRDFNKVKSSTESFMAPVTPGTTDEVEEREWEEVQSNRDRVEVEPRIFAVNPVPSAAAPSLSPFRGQIYPGVMLHGCPVVRSSEEGTGPASVM
ncbi:unnamed protein product, partial [Scytosiphon promiscuus]